MPTVEPKTPTKPRGQNAYQAFLTSMVRDVPKELRRSATVRRALRKGVG